MARELSFSAVSCLCEQKVGIARHTGGLFWSIMIASDCLQGTEEEVTAQVICEPGLF